MRKTRTKTAKAAEEPCKPQGTVLKLRRCDLLGLAECPASVAGPILHNFVRWFCGLPSQPLKEPLANAVLTGFRERHNSRFEAYEARRLEWLEQERAAIAVQNREEQA